jgi:hypothetical protein
LIYSEELDFSTETSIFKGWKMIIAGNSLLRVVVAAICAFGAAACQDSNMQKENIQSEATCKIASSLTQFLDEGAKNRSVWEKALSGEIRRNNPFAESFLRSWRRGDRPSVIQLSNCINRVDSRSSAFVLMWVRDMGEVEIHVMADAGSLALVGFFDRSEVRSMD